jgi:hypothetical protein
MLSRQEIRKFFIDIDRPLVVLGGVSKQVDCCLELKAEFRKRRRVLSADGLNNV